MGLVDAGEAFGIGGGAFHDGVFKIFGGVFVPFADVGVEFWCVVERLDNVLHVEGLAVDEGAEVEHDALGFVALADDGSIGMLKGGKFFLVTLAFAFELFGNLLLENKSFKGVVALLFRARKADSEACSVVLLLLDERREAAVLTFMVFDLDFEVLSLFGELLGKRLEFEELDSLSVKRPINQL